MGNIYDTGLRFGGGAVQGAPVGLSVVDGKMCGRCCVVQGGAGLTARKGAQFDTYYAQVAERRTYGP